jgi:putative oxidoreductase
MHYDDSARPLESAAALVGRLLLVPLFLTQGWVKLMAGPDIIGAYFVKVGVPAPMLAFYVVLALELLLAAILLVGWYTRPIALLLAAYCVATALFGHFELGDRNQWLHFLKNLGLTGGFLHVFAFGGGAYSVDRLTSGRSRRCDAPRAF